VQRIRLARSTPQGARAASTASPLSSLLRFFTNAGDGTVPLINYLDAQVRL